MQARLGAVFRWYIQKTIGAHPHPNTKASGRTRPCSITKLGWCTCCLRETTRKCFRRRLLITVQPGRCRELCRTSQAAHRAGLRLRSRLYIQLKYNAAHKGDLVACLDYSNLPGHEGRGAVERSGTLVSSDPGESWFTGATHIVGDECAVAELPNGLSVARHPRHPDTPTPRHPYTLQSSGISSRANVT